jgi:hypothetical protein
VVEATVCCADRGHQHAVITSARPGGAFVVVLLRGIANYCGDSVIDVCRYVLAAALDEPTEAPLFTRVPADRVAVDRAPLPDAPGAMVAALAARVDRAITAIEESGGGPFYAFGMIACVTPRHVCFVRRGFARIARIRDGERTVVAHEDSLARREGLPLDHPFANVAVSSFGRSTTAADTFELALAPGDRLVAVTQELLADEDPAHVADLDKGYARVAIDLAR